MKQVKRGRIPYSGKRIIPIYRICGRCRKNKVTNHHFLCDKCHTDVDIEKKIKRVILDRKININDVKKIRDCLYADYKIYRSTYIVGEYISDLIKRRILKGGEKNGNNCS